MTDRLPKCQHKQTKIKKVIHAETWIINDRAQKHHWMRYKKCCADCGVIA